METPKTEYAEIATYLRGRYRVLMGPDDHAFAQLGTIPSDISREEFLATSNLPDAVNRFLLQLDTKVDMLLAGMQASTLDQDFPYSLEVLTIGASKLEFTAKRPLAKGDWLEVVLKLGAATASGIGSIAARRVDKDGTPFFTFCFSRINEEEREKIIRYVFKEERRILRETRLE